MRKEYDLTELELRKNPYAKKLKKQILTKGNTPVARLVSIASSQAVPRVAGIHPDAIWISDDFDEPLPDEFWLGKA